MVKLTGQARDWAAALGILRAPPATPPEQMSRPPRCDRSETPANPCNSAITPSSRQGGAASFETPSIHPHHHRSVQRAACSFVLMRYPRPVACGEWRVVVKMPLDDVVHLGDRMALTEWQHPPANSRQPYRGQFTSLPSMILGRHFGCRLQQLAPWPVLRRKIPQLVSSDSPSPSPWRIDCP